MQLVLTLRGHLPFTDAKYEFHYAVEAGQLHIDYFLTLIICV